MPCHQIRAALAVAWQEVRCRRTLPGGSSRLTSINHFLFVPVTIGLAFLTALLQTAWHRRPASRVPAADPVLRHAAGHQRRGRRRDRPGAGVPVRHELVGLLPDGRRRLRRAARDGGARAPSSSSRRSSGCGCSAGTSCPAGCTSPTIWLVALGRGAVGGVHHGGELVDAAPGRLHDQPDHGQPQLNDIWARADQPGVPVGLRARPARLAGHRRGRDARRLGLAAAPGRRTARRLRPGRPGSLWSCSSRRSCWPCSSASELGRDRGQVPADEDRGRRGAVDDLPAVLVLAVPDRRRQRRPHPDQDHRRSRTCSRCWRPTTGTARSSA